jgi:hypothetical protein
MLTIKRLANNQRIIRINNVCKTWSIWYNIKGVKIKCVKRNQRTDDLKSGCENKLNLSQKIALYEI